ncbi:hydroxylysine kinase-like isoform X2 [Pungitius pungitius]|uniref:hydroxylysine kinase-like isoform X2 n=1 Tax=Pungitius pungitius TaxID=134920 RepID=UPI002E1267FA
MDIVPGADHRPMLTLQQGTQLTLRLYGVTLTEISTLPSYNDQNFLIVTKDNKYVLKIMNSEESMNPTRMEVQTLAMSFLRQEGVPSPIVVPTTTGKLMSMEEIESPVTVQDLYHIGKLAAVIDTTLKQLVSPNLDVLHENKGIWSLSNIPLIHDYLSVMDGDPLQIVIKAVIEQYKLHVAPRIVSLRKGIIHGDMSDQNIIVTPVDNGRHEVSGVLDFSQLMIDCYVFEVAITIAYMMMENPSPLHVGGAVLAGWESIMVLSDEEKDSLFLLVLGRLCQSLVYGRYNVTKYPDNKEYLLTTAKSGTLLLTKLWEMGKKNVERKWFTDAAIFKEK